MSEFWQRKMRTFFNSHDFNRGGYINQETFVGIIHSLANALNTEPEAREKVAEDMGKLWLKFMKAGDLKKDARLTVAILIESMKQQLYDPEFILLGNAVVRGMFHMLDVSRDGYLQREEFETWIRSGHGDAGGSPELWDTRVAFDAIDTNSDGELSIDEFVRAFFDFFFSQDETSPSKFFFGRLVD